MGNKSTKGFSESGPQPGRPRVKLVSHSYRRHISKIVSSDLDAVSDNVQLKWSPCSRLKKDHAYEIEMWDLGLQEWVRVAEAETCNCILSNILSGIMYRFRVRAIFADGSVSEASEPSDPFVIDIPGVQIAPYWIETPPSFLSLTIGQPLKLRARALGTPKPSFHWYKGSQELFINERVVIETPREDESQISIACVSSDDSGVIKCAAINHLGKCLWDTKIDLKSKPQFTLPGFLRRPVYCSVGELIRIKIPLVGMPEPELYAEKVDNPTSTSADDVKLFYRNNFAVFQIDSPSSKHNGKWKITASNPIDSDHVHFDLEVTGVPHPPHGIHVEELSQDSVRLEWQDRSSNDFTSSGITRNYRVEYNREKWEIWLRGCLVSEKHCIITGLIPGSRYRFRVFAVSKQGEVSEPSEESEPIFLGAPIEDEVFGLPGGNYPKDFTNSNRQRLHLFGSCRNSKRFGSMTNFDSDDSGINKTSSKQNRQLSLEREVFYLDSDRRQEVVTYTPSISGSTARKFRLTPEEEDIYKRSLESLASQMIKVSRTKLNHESQHRSHPDSKLCAKKILQRLPMGEDSKNQVSQELVEKRLESSLTDLFQRLKAISMKDVSQKHARAISEEPSFYRRINRPLKKSTSVVDAHKALEDTCSRISSMQSLLMQPLSPIPFSSLSNLSKLDMTERFIRTLPPSRSFATTSVPDRQMESSKPSNGFDVSFVQYPERIESDEEVNGGDDIGHQYLSNEKDEIITFNGQNLTSISPGPLIDSDDLPSGKAVSNQPEYLIEQKLEEADDPVVYNNETIIIPVNGVNPEPCSPASRSTSRASEATLLCSFEESDATSRTLVNTPDILDNISELSCDLT